MEREVILYRYLGEKIGSGEASSVPPDSFLIGPLKGHCRLTVTFPPKQIIFYCQTCNGTDDDVRR